MDYNTLVVKQLHPDNQLLKSWALTGGVSAQVTALELQTPDGQTQRYVVRQHGVIDRTRNPNIARDEFTLLKHLHAAGVAVPKAHLHGEIDGLPYVVVEFIEGGTDFAPKDLDGCLQQLATHLAQIHRVDTVGLDFLPHETAVRIINPPAQLDEALGEAQIRATLTAIYPIPQHNPTALLHGDFWLGNTLWREGEVVAVIDWEDAALGDPVADVANARLELLWAFDLAAMERFTALYCALNPLDLRSLPYWDLVMALRPAGKIAEWAEDEDSAQKMYTKHRQFVAQAMAKCQGGS